MRSVIVTALGLGASALVVYVLAGLYAAVRSGRSMARVDLAVGRATRGALVAFGLVTGAAILVRHRTGPQLDPALRIILIYAAPLVWCWMVVLGSSWTEQRGRGLTGNLWWFHRYNLLLSFLLFGQRIPFFSAAMAAPADVAAGSGLFWPLLGHLVLAALVGWVIRWAMVAWYGGVRPLPDTRLAVQVRAVAREAGILLRGILMVPTERGQTLNAVAATTSRFVFVAEGFWRGLPREELRSVLLHEVAHLGQRGLNLLRSVGHLWWPAFLWVGRHVAGRVGSVAEALPWVAGMAAAGLVGAASAVVLRRVAERGADEFAVRWGAPEALAAAVRRLRQEDARLAAG